MDSKKKTKRIALAGVLSAAAVIIMSLGSVITSLDMTAAFAAGILVIIARIECDRITAVGVYAVSGILAFVLLPNKNVAIVFLFYGGLYSILKEFCELIKVKPLMWLVKLIISNVMLTLIVWLGMYFTVASDEPLGFVWWVYLLGNFIFVAYVIALTLMISRYYVLFRHRRN